MFENVVGDRVHDVSLAETDPAVNEERVVIFARLLGDRLRGGDRQSVVVADDEGVESVVGIEDVDALFVLDGLVLDRLRRGKTVLFVLSDYFYARHLGAARLDRRLDLVGVLNGHLLEAVERSDKNEDVVFDRVGYEIFEPKIEADGRDHDLKLRQNRSPYCLAFVHTDIILSSRTFFKNII